MLSLGTKRTKDGTLLKAQLKRYQAAVEANVTFYPQFAEGAFIVRDAWFSSQPLEGPSDGPLGAASKGGFSTNDLNCAWWNEYTREDASDRDQLALASAMATLPALQPGAQLATRSRFRAHNTTNNQGLVLLAEGSPPKCKICFPVLVKKHGEGDTTVSNCAGKV